MAHNARIAVPRRKAAMFSVLRALYSCLALLALAGVAVPAAADAPAAATPTFTMQPVGWIRKREGKTFVEIEPRYRPALLGVEKLRTLQVLWWFDRNDTPEQRAVLRVHPRGDMDRPLTGVFATRSPLRPNLIALSEVEVTAVRDNLVEIGPIDAWADTPVLDLKP
jgi:tRNA-Thr(GGU) m(6)t(6)A37 methyltransferase TsaA